MGRGNGIGCGAQLVIVAVGVSMVVGMTWAFWRPTPKNVIDLDDLVRAHGLDQGGGWEDIREEAGVPREGLAGDRIWIRTPHGEEGWIDVPAGTAKALEVYGPGWEMEFEAGGAGRSVPGERGVR